MEYVIYRLFDPNTKCLRYIGYTSHIDKRLRERHMLILYEKFRCLCLV